MTSDTDTLFDPCLAAGFSDLDSTPPEADPRDAVIDRAWEAAVQYELHEEIARGGVGAIVRARDDRLGRDIALKFLRDEHRSNGAIVRRFVAEAQIGGQLQHPGIVPVYDVGVADGKPFFAMKLVEGRTLAELLRDRADAQAEQHRLLGVFEQVCQTVAYAHSRGVLHRDLKPANVMLGAFGEVQVVDWGLSKVVGSDEPEVPRGVEAASAGLSVTGSVMGTYAYMPPEQARGETDTLDERADVFALGAILTEILTGAPPYTGTKEDLKRQARAGDLDAAKRRLDEDSAEPELVCLAVDCLSDRREARPRDAKVVAERIAEHLANVEARAKQAGIDAAAANVRAATARRALVLSVALIVVFLAGFVASMLFWLGAREATKREVSARTDAEKHLGRFNLLAYGIKLREAKTTAASLVPAWPDKIEPMQAWMSERARPLVAALPELAGALAEMRARALPWSPAQKRADRRELEPELSAARGVLASFSPGHKYYDLQTRVRTPEYFELAKAAAAAEVAALEAAIAERRTFELTRTEDQFLHDALATLVSDLEAFVGGELRCTEEALAWARELTARSVAKPAALWAKARRAILESEKYGGLDLAPQLGLVPLRENPATGLWEFLHLRSGTPGKESPALDTKTARYRLTADSGIVFVLVPGGKNVLGAQREDPGRPRYDPAASQHETPLQRVRLAPYFLAKHEVTQEQWKRLTDGADPSLQRPGMIPGPHNKRRVGADIAPIRETHPVERVSWTRANEVLSQHGLVLPTEAQWEHACRAGTHTPWWTGKDAASLRGKSNICGSLRAKYDGAMHAPDHRDGYYMHGPVGSYDPNPFGLYDMHGNVAEHCRDMWGPYGQQTEGREGLKKFGSGSMRMVRGGSHITSPAGAGAARRIRVGPERRSNAIGVRACRRIL